MSEKTPAPITANPASTSSNPSQIHSFSHTIAEEHGEKAAVILQYLAHHFTKPIQNSI